MNTRMIGMPQRIMYALFIREEPVLMEAVADTTMLKFLGFSLLVHHHQVASLEQKFLE